MVASCGAPADDPTWGSELQEYFGAFAAAASGGDLEQTMAFFDDRSMLVDSAGVSAIGLRRIDMAMRSAMSVDAVRRPWSIFIALQRQDDWRRSERAAFGLVPGDALLLSEVEFGEELGCAPDRVPCTLRELALVTVDGSSIMGYATTILASDIGALAPDEPELHDDLAALEQFHRSYAETWSSLPPDDVAGMYDEYATIDHSAWGMSVRGHDAIAPAVALLRDEFGDVRWEPATLSDLGMSSDEPAVFFAGSPAEPHVIAGMYVVSVPAEEPSMVGVVWRRGPTGIVHEWSAWEVGSQAVADLVSSSDPWWAGLEVPWVEPADCTEVEGPSGDVFEVCNASPELLSEVRWALSRFEAANLTVPLPSRISFPPNTRCRQVPGEGWAVDTGAGVDLLMCRVDDLERLRFVMLHELGHVWSNQNLDDASRDAFAASRGLESWRDAEGEWRDQASEHAAEVLAWGLMDRAVPMSRLPDASCDRLAAAFRLLTGVEPLITPEECESG